MVAIFFLGTYVAQLAQGTEAGFHVRALESATDDLRRETEQLSVGVTELRRMETVMARLQILGLVQPERVVYLSDPTPLALK